MAGVAGRAGQGDGGAVRPLCLLGHRAAALGVESDGVGGNRPLGGEDDGRTGARRGVCRTGRVEAASKGLGDRLWH